MVLKIIEENKIIEEKYNESKIINNENIFYWISIDSQNQVIMGGGGEARLETSKFKYSFPYVIPTEYEKNKKFLESITSIDEKVNINSLKLLKDPIVNRVPLIVKKTNDLAMNDIANYTYLPNSFLTPINQKLFECISGKNFILNDKDFPCFSKAIEYSISSKTGWCHKKLQEKSTEFNPDKSNINGTYLRITLGCNSGESPGVPFVMEIWPPQRYSPIHSHAGTNAIIRVLHGSINVKIFPCLSGNLDICPFAEANFKKEDITWLSPELNQIHQLKNNDSKKRV